MAQSARRYLILPHREIDSARVIRVAATDDGTPQETGINVRQPTVATAPKGDIRPTLSGVPDAAAAGDVTLNLAGPVDIARFGWVRDGDTALQMRQSPMVCGRRPDVVRRTTTKYTNRPKLLPLKSGKLLAMWMEADAPAPLLPGSPTGAPQSSRYEPDESPPAWTAAGSMVGPGNVNGPSTAGAGMSTAARVGIDAVQFPDTGEIVCFVPVQDSNLSPTDRRLYVYHSVDDGDTWIERARAFAQGTKPSFEFKTTAGAADASPMQCVAAELLDSGRIVVFIHTGRGLYALTSDDRGSTWSRTTIHDDISGFVSPLQPAGTTVACGKMRNGSVVVVAGTLRAVSFDVSRRLYVTVDGTRFSAALTFPDVAYQHTQEMAVTMRPDGWPAIYGCLHTFIDSYNLPGAATVHADWLTHGSLRKRDPAMQHTVADLFPPAGMTPFHCTESAGSAGRYPYMGGGAYKLHGFVSLDAVSYRGQVVIAAQVARDNGSESSPAIAESAIVIYRLNHWQPALESLAEVTAADVRFTDPPIRGRIYNRTWDCYGVPEQWGFAAAGAGTGTIEPSGGGGSEGTYLKIATGSSTRNYTDTSLPNDSAGRYGVVRAVMQCASGGALISDRMALKLALDDGATGVGLEARFLRDVSTTSIAVYDQVTNAQIGSTVTVPNDRWIEILMGVYLNSAIVLARVDEGEADWDAPYQTVCNTTLTAGSVSDELSFGHYTVGASESWWKTVQIHRPAEAFPFGASPLSILVSSFKDSHTVGDLSASGEGLSAQDAGVVNVMRCSQATASPSQYLTRGVHVAWRGEAITEGAYDWATGYDYEAAAIQRQPVMAEWRSADDAKDIEIVLDAGDGVRFRPEAIAVLGRNVPHLTVQLNDADSWGSPAFYWSYGWPGANDAAAAYSHLWNYDASEASGAGWKYAVLSGRVAVYPPTGAGPWRPHQFRSQATGPRYYWVINHAGTERCYRIRDNDADCLILETPPAISDVATIVSESSFIFDSDWAIFSDRFAATMGWRYDGGTHTLGGTTYPSLAAKGFRYLRLLLRGVTHMDADEQFIRCGRVVLGRALELHLPDAQWGWGRNEDSGHDLNEGGAGATYSRRRTSPRRTWRFDYAALLPANEADAVSFSPARQPTRKSWQSWLDAMRALELDGTPAALVWEGDRALGVTGGDEVQVAGDPQDVMMVRVTSAGNVEQTGYDSRDLNLPGGAECVPRPVCLIKGITFREEF